MAIQEDVLKSVVIERARQLKAQKVGYLRAIDIIAKEIRREKKGKPTPLGILKSNIIQKDDNKEVI